MVNAVGKPLLFTYRGSSLAKCASGLPEQREPRSLPREPSLRLGAVTVCRTIGGTGVALACKARVKGRSREFGTIPCYREMTVCKINWTLI